MEKIEKPVHENSIENAYAHAEEAIENARAKKNEVLKEVKEKGQSFWNSSWAARRQTWGWTKDFIQKHPGQAVGYAVLLGAVFTALIYPRGRR